jgi:hypothetical protein
MASVGKDLPSNTPAARVFISYKRDANPDQPLAAKVFQALASQGHRVFIDQTMRTGTEWAKEIESQIRQSDFLIVFLTDVSIRSEMVKGEVEIARKQAQGLAGKPRVLPVRLAYAGPLPYPLNAYLDPIQYAIWRGESDTARLLQELQEVVGGRPVALAPIPVSEPMPGGDLPPAYAANLQPPGGTLDVDDPWYVRRSSDAKALGLIGQTVRGQTITIKGPRQMGKSSLLMRIVAAAIEAGKKPVLLDFQLLDHETRSSAGVCYRRFAAAIAEQLDLPHDVEKVWDASLPDPQNCSRYVEKQILSKLDAVVTLAIDEADMLFATDFRADFFAMLRTWHNDRGNPVKKAWRKLDLILVTSTEPYMFIDRAVQSPFNVGEVLALEDFSPEQVEDLNRRHRSPLFPQEVRRLVDLVAGHPYLTRKALYLIAGRQPTLSPDELFQQAAEDSGPFGDHLRYYLLRLQEKPELIEALLDVVHRHGCDDVVRAHRLEGAGLVKRQAGKVVPRCLLYEEYFRERLKARA